MSELYLGDCLERMRDLADNSVDSIVTDPPYGLSFMGKKWDVTVPSVEIWKEALRVLKPGGHLLAFGGTRTYHHLAMNIELAGFEIRDQLQWIYGQGFPKSHDISKAIDKDAGAERDRIPGGQGAPNALYGGRKAGQAISGLALTDTAKKWNGWGTALKPANEPIVLARKPLSEKTIAKNVLEHGVGGINVEGCRIGNEERVNPPFGVEGWRKIEGREDTCESREKTTLGRFPSNVILDEEAARLLDEQSGISAARGGKPKQKSEKTGNVAISATGGEKVVRNDIGGASRFFMVIKKSISDERAEECGLEKIEVVDTFVGRKKANRKDNSNIDGSGSKQTDQFLMGTISIIGMETHSIMSFQILNASTNMNIGLCTIVTEKIISKSMESSIENVKLVSPTEALISLGNEKQEPIKGIASIVLAKSYDLGENKIENTTTPTIANIVGDRFLYVAKASPSERADNFHPTVKPIALMEYLIKLVTPPHGIVLDPFMGSGTTGVAAKRLGFNFVGIELDKKYFNIAKNRIEV